MLTSGSSPTTEGLGDGLWTLWLTKLCGWWRGGRGGGRVGVWWGVGVVVWSAGVWGMGLGVGLGLDVGVGVGACPTHPTPPHSAPTPHPTSQTPIRAHPTQPAQPTTCHPLEFHATSWCAPPCLHTPHTNFSGIWGI